MSINFKSLLAGLRIVFAMLGLSAVVTEIATLIERGVFMPTRFFSYFTVESNLFAVVILLFSTQTVAREKREDRTDLLRGSSTLNMIVVGIVFSLLLAGRVGELTAVPWDNTVLHYIMPVYVALDWLMDPPRVRIKVQRALVWMMFPILYVLYSLIRGHFVGWYPYPFLDPNEQGYLGVAITSFLIAFGSIALIWILTRVTGRKKVGEVAMHKSDER